MLRTLFFMLSMLFLVSCSSVRPLSETKYVTTKEIRFIPYPKQGMMNYQVTYRLNEQFLKPFYITIEFENPMDETVPMLIPHKINAGITELNLTSPPFNAIKNKTNYDVTLRLYASDNTNSLFATHHDSLLFKINKKIFPQLHMREL